jgi:hypothetical protein
MTSGGVLGVSSITTEGTDISGLGGATTLTIVASSGTIQIRVQNTASVNTFWTPTITWEKTIPGS